jgi:hypothetical protein
VAKDGFVVKNDAKLLIQLLPLLLSVDASETLIQPSRKEKTGSSATVSQEVIYMYVGN